MHNLNIKLISYLTGIGLFLSGHFVFAACRPSAVSCVKGKVISMKEIPSGKKTKIYVATIKVRSKKDLAETLKHTFKAKDTISVIFTSRGLEKTEVKSEINVKVMVADLCDQDGFFDKFTRPLPKLQIVDKCE